MENTNAYMALLQVAYENGVSLNMVINEIETAIKNALDQAKKRTKSGSVDYVEKDSVCWRISNRRRTDYLHWRQDFLILCAHFYINNWSVSDINDCLPYKGSPKGELSKIFDF